MYKLIRFYNQNRKKIFKIILIIVFILAIIQLLNYFSKISKKDVDINNVNIVNNSNNIHQELVSNKSVVTGEKIDEHKLDNDVEIINKFMRYCNEGSLQEAYDLLSDDCIEVMFPSIDDFKNIYYIPVFNEEAKIYTVSNWVNDIYKVQINDDILSIGRYDEENTIIDYISVVEEDNDIYKLNINSYIEREDLNKEVNYDRITIKVIKADIYMDYSLYTFEIINGTDRIILLDDLTNIDSFYLEDTKKLKYSAFTHELTQENLKLGASERRQIDIKYYNKYSSTRKISNICFSKIIYDYEKYKSLEDKNRYNDFYKINIEI